MESINLASIQQQLLEHAVQQGFKDLAFESCQTYMRNVLNESGLEGLGGYTLEEIQLKFRRQALIFDNSLHGTPFIRITLGLHEAEADDDLYCIGYYDLDIGFDGEAFDDWLIIDQEKHNNLVIASFLKDLDESLPAHYLKRNSIYFEYISYIAHIVNLYQARNLSACQVFIKRAFQFLERTEVKEDFREYAQKTKSFLQQIIAYLDECELLSASMKVFQKKHL